VRLEDVLRKLESAQREAATAAVERPGDGTSFAYGRAVGIYTGLAEARRLIEAMHEEEEDRLTAI
jgi:hypothetical protein